VRLDDCIHKGESETVTGRMFSLYESLEYAAANIGRDAWTVVFNYQFC
jgi:hypothetical protein